MHFYTPEAKDLKDLIHINEVAQEFGLDPTDLARIQNEVVYARLESLGLPNFKQIKKTVTHTLLEWLGFSRSYVGAVVLAWFMPKEHLLYYPKHQHRLMLVG